MTDPIVAEVRKHREAHAKRFGGDPKAICVDLRKIQKACGHKVISLPLKRIRRRRTLAANA